MTSESTSPFMQPSEEELSARRCAWVYIVTGLLIVASLLFPERTEDPTHYRIIYSIWSTTALLIPMVSFYFFAKRSAVARDYWRFFYTGAFAAYCVHFYYAVFVEFGGFRGTIDGQGALIAYGNFILTAIWLIDVLLAWTATRFDFRFIRHLVPLLIITLAFLFFATIRNDGIVRWIGSGLAIALIASPVASYLIFKPQRAARPEGWPQESYLRGSLAEEMTYVQRFIEDINAFQRKTKDRNFPSPVRRAVHAKQHLGVTNARFEVCENIPNDIRLSLFAEENSFDATVRFSSASGVARPDSVKDLFGIAVRVHVGEQHAHDFLATNAPASHARDAYQFMALLRSITKPFRFLLPFRLMFAIGPFEAVRMLYVVLTSRRKISSVLAESYWSRAPIAVGERVAVRYTFVPQNSPATAPKDANPNFLRAEALSQLQQRDVKFDLVFQRFVNEKKTPIEDSSANWSESDSPPFKVAELTIPKQKLGLAATDAIEAQVHELQFNPWRTSQELRPLGSQNRARQLVYKSSSDFRLRRKEHERHPFYIELPIKLLTPVFAALNRFVPWHRMPLQLIEILNLDTFRVLLREKNLHDPEPLPQLKASTLIQDFEEQKTTARQSDGTYNDLTDPEMGKAGSAFGRNVPIEKLQTPTRQSVLDPNPRTISRKLHARDTFIPATTLNIAAAAWIQFQVHGWFNHTKLAGMRHCKEFWEIDIAEDDPWIEYENPMRIPKTPVKGRSSSGIPTFANTETHWWDASQIYGNSAKETESLREKERGYMRMDGDFLPPDPRWEKYGILDHTGFNDNYWLGLSLMHTLFVKEHNAICDRLMDEFPDRRSDDHWLFEKARLVNAALMAKIHTVEWTPGILGRKSLQTSMRANWWGLLGEEFKETFGRFNETEEVSGIVGSFANHHSAPYALTEDFVTVYRMHPLMPDEFVLFDRSGNTDSAHTLEDVNGFGTRKIMEGRSQADLWYSLGVAHPGAIGLKNFPNQLRDLVVMGKHHIDLATIDNVRDRERALPRYNDFRRNLRMAPITRWKDITKDPALAEEIRDCYGGDLEKVDTMVGLHAEPPPIGFGFSDTAFRVFILMASRRLKSDRFYTNDFNIATYTKPGLDWVRDNLMTDVLLRHFPELQTSLEGLDNAFAPWNVVHSQVDEQGARS